MIRVSEFFSQRTDSFEDIVKDMNKAYREGEVKRSLIKEREAITSIYEEFLLIKHLIKSKPDYKGIKLNLDRIFNPLLELSLQKRLSMLNESFKEEHYKNFLSDKENYIEVFMCLDSIKKELDRLNDSVKEDDFKIKYQVKSKYDFSKRVRISSVEQNQTFIELLPIFINKDDVNNQKTSKNNSNEFKKEINTSVNEKRDVSTEFKSAITSKNTENKGFSEVKGKNIQERKVSSIRLSKELIQRTDSFRKLAKEVIATYKDEMDKDLVKERETIIRLYNGLRFIKENLNGVYIGIKIKASGLDLETTKEEIRVIIDDFLSKGKTLETRLINLKISLKTESFKNFYDVFTMTYPIMMEFLLDDIKKLFTRSEIKIKYKEMKEEQERLERKKRIEEMFKKDREEKAARINKEIEKRKKKEEKKKLLEEEQEKIRKEEEEKRKNDEAALANKRKHHILFLKGCDINPYFYPQFRGECLHLGEINGSSIEVYSAIQAQIEFLALDENKKSQDERRKKVKILCNLNKVFLELESYIRKSSSNDELKNIIELLKSENPKNLNTFLRDIEHILISSTIKNLIEENEEIYRIAKEILTFLVLLGVGYAIAKTVDVFKYGNSGAECVFFKDPIRSRLKTVGMQVDQLLVPNVSKN